MKPDELKKWLSETGKTREWLASQCNVSKRTVDGWFTKGIPSIAVALIKRLIQDDSLGEVKLDFDQWKRISVAMEKTGYTDFREFAADALNAQIEREMLRERSDVPSEQTVIERMKRRDQNR